MQVTAKKTKTMIPEKTIGGKRHGPGLPDGLFRTCLKIECVAKKRRNQVRGGRERKQPGGAVELR
jgi:hypothetical protein